MGCDGLVGGVLGRQHWFRIVQSTQLPSVLRCPGAVADCRVECVEFDQNVTGRTDSVASATGQQATNPTVSSALIAV